MILDHIRFREKHLPFRHPFTISGGRTKTHQPVFQLAIHAGGMIGYGEAPEISYYGITCKQMATDLEGLRSVLENTSVLDPEVLYDQLKRWLPENSFLRCAIDMAAWDLFAKLQHKPIHACWEFTYETQLLTDFTIGIGSMSEMLARMEETPWPVYKIKLGFEGDVEVLSELRRHTSVPLRVDVNGGWQAEEARRKLSMLKDLDIELVEQPLHKDSPKASRDLFRISPLPLFADESCVSEEDVASCAGSFHGINIKLTKCGGITPALRMIRNARSLGMKVMMGSMNESSIGTAAIAQFLPQLDYVDMDGPLLLTEDTARGLQFDSGKVILSDLPGLGIELLDPF